jgi:predicted HTH domain antitoxin
VKPFDFYADRLSGLVRRAVEEEKISISRAAEILNLSSEQMMELIVEWEDFG